MTSLKLVTTIRERCRVCYTCVRECPAKAIRIIAGQAEVMSDRCIGCGNCIRVCRQSAKQDLSGIPSTAALIASPAKVAAMVAPSFPAEFTDMDYRVLVAMIRRLGFDRVCEVAVGADLVAEAYRRLTSEPAAEGWIGSTCPAVVSYVEKYFPHLVGRLAPIASPMVATARALRRLFGDDIKTVFIGPCIAKKGEAAATGEVDAVLTFVELRQMLRNAGISSDPGRLTPAEFDPPRPGLGMLFPVSRGLLQAAGKAECLVTEDITAADGRSSFVQAIKELHDGTLDTRLLEVLCCQGCIMGPGMGVDRSLFSRRNAVRDYVRARLGQSAAKGDAPARMSWEPPDLSMSFAADDRRIPQPTDENIDAVLLKMGKVLPEDELDCGACGYDTCREHAVAILKGLAESEMCLPFVIDRLKSSLEELHLSNEQLADTRQALLNAEKLASMGQLAAGIAHEINNPLGVILLYAKLLEEAPSTDDTLRDDLRMIVDQAERCRSIATGLLNFARKNKLALRRCDFRQLIDGSLRMLIVPENVRLEVLHRPGDLTLDIDPDQITQVVINLVMNAVEAMPEGGTIRISTDNDEKAVRLLVEDTGLGIPAKIMKQIFEPLFTTKQIGKGCGLGLAVTYGIIKMHGGRIEVSSNADRSTGPTGATFVVTLPRDGGDAAGHPPRADADHAHRGEL